MNPTELKGSLEAIIYAADDPATLDQLAKATETEKEEVRVALEEMIAACAADDRGIELRRVARGYRYSTKAQHHEVVRKFIKNLRPPVRLSMPALETLAVIAYKQPITLPEIQEIRGVNCSGVIQTLLEKHLVATAGRKAVIGRPILYRTTREFLVRFGLNDVDELPSLKEFEQLAREALGPDAGIEIVPEGESGETLAESSQNGEAPAEARDGAPAEPETVNPADSSLAESAEQETNENGAGMEPAESQPYAEAGDNKFPESQSEEHGAAFEPSAIAGATEPAEEPQPVPEPAPEPELPEPESEPEPEPEPAPAGAQQPETDATATKSESAFQESPQTEEETPDERSRAN